MSCGEMRKRLENMLAEISQRQAYLAASEWEEFGPRNEVELEEAWVLMGPLSLGFKVEEMIEHVEAYEGLDSAAEAFSTLENVVKIFETWPQATPAEIKAGVLKEFRANQAHWAWGDELASILALDLD